MFKYSWVRATRAGDMEDIEKRHREKDRDREIDLWNAVSKEIGKDKIKSAG